MNSETLRTYYIQYEDIDKTFSGWKIIETNFDLKSKLDFDNFHNEFEKKFNINCKINSFTDITKNVSKIRKMQLYEDLIKSIYYSLPSNRDWLNPDDEKLMKRIINKEI